FFFMPNNFVVYFTITILINSRFAPICFLSESRWVLSNKILFFIHSWTVLCWILCFCSLVIPTPLSFASPAIFIF
uniref:Uncharacterized protein n=1 Tax=Vombatus ursinus TaxID=29139 RepID=A0A4X2KSK2_VOMUR